MSVLRLSHACLGSRNLPRTIQFYRELVGCDVAHEFRNAKNDLYGVFLDCGNGTFLEFFNEDRELGQGGLFRHLCFEVPNIEQMANTARRLGLTADVRRGRTDRILQFFVYDPDGNQIEFQQHDGESVLYSRLPERGPAP